MGGVGTHDTGTFSLKIWIDVDGAFLLSDSFWPILLPVCVMLLSLPSTSTRDDTIGGVGATFDIPTVYMTQ
jgi:hypothetical protein